MVKLAAFLDRRRWLVAGAWLLVVLASMPLAARQTENLTGGGFDVPGSQSEAVDRALSDQFASADRGRLTVVLEPQPGVTPAGSGAAVKRVAGAVAEADGARVAPPIAAAARRKLAAGQVALVPIDAEGDADELIDSATGLRGELSPGEPVDGVTAYVIGQPAMWAALSELSKEDLARAEVTGFPIVALILVAVFGSLAAASLPLALGLVAVLITGAVIYLLALQLEMSVFVTNMASMIGIGVAVDYSLFILARFRESVRAGNGATAARAEALSTSGLAVVFSGTAVIISLAGLWMVQNQALRSMALGAMVVVAIAILVATTLLPALIRLLGHRVEAGGVAWSIFGAGRRVWRRRRRPGSTDPERATFWQRWTAAVMRRPVLSVVAVTALLLTLALPVLDLKTGNGAIEQFPPDHEARVGVELAAETTGGGSDAILVLATFDHGSLDDRRNTEAVREFSHAAAGDPLATHVSPAVPATGGPSDDADAGAEGMPGAGQTVLIEIDTRAESAEADEAIALVERLRGEIVPAAGLATVATVDVGGESARINDARVQISGSIWKLIAFVLAFSYVVLTLMLRSVLLPLKAILMNLLSIGAAYGVLVAVFQWGWLDGFLGFESLGSLDTLTPPLVLAVVFGLSMDYEVFLLSRIKERYEAHGDNRRAVAEGLSSSAATISSAALIMVAVFSVFVLTGVPSIKEIGLGNAVAIAIDATLVRLILVPAAMVLMGRWNWWLPAWLDRLLPHVGLEGEAPPRGARAPDPQPA
jgi:RND superfamily putative drug exporter